MSVTVAAASVHTTQIVRDNSPQRGPFGEKSASGGLLLHNLCCVIGGFARPGAQTRRNEHRRTGPFLHASRRTERKPNSSGVAVLPPDNTRSVQAWLAPACLRAFATRNGTKRSGRRTAESARSGAAAQRSVEQRKRSGRVRPVPGGSRRVLALCPVRKPRRAGTSIVAGARVPAPSRAVCRRLVRGAGAAHHGVGCGSPRRLIGLPV